MITIVDLLKTRRLDTWLDAGDVWLEWEHSSNQWVVFAHRGVYVRVLETSDETAAVAAFMKASGFDAETARPGAGKEKE